MYVDPLTMYMLWAISGTDPLKESYLKFSNDYQFLVNQVYDEIDARLEDIFDDDLLFAYLDTRREVALKTPYEEGIQQKLLEETNKEIGKSYDSYEQLFEKETGSSCPELNHPMDYTCYIEDDGCLIEVEINSSYEWRYYITEVPTDGSQVTLFEH